MTLPSLFSQLEEKDFYKKFKVENPGAYLSAVFAILTKNEKESDKIQFDFFLPEKNKFAYTEHPFEKMNLPDDKMEKSEGVDLGGIVDVVDLWDEIENAKKKNNFVQTTSKIIAVLRNGIWNVTALDNFLGIIQMKMNSKTREVLEIKKGGLGDFMGIKK